MYIHTYIDICLYIYIGILYLHMSTYAHTHVRRLTPEAGPGFEAEPAADARATGLPRQAKERSLNERLDFLEEQIDDIRQQVVADRAMREALEHCVRKHEAEQMKEPRAA